MLYRTELARNAAGSLGISLSEAAQVIGRIDAAAPGAIYRDVVGGMIAEAVDEATRTGFVTLPGSSAQDVLKVAVHATSIEDDEHLTDIVDGYLSVMWGDLWANHEEENGNPPRGEITDLMPEAPEEALVEASFGIGRVEGANGKSVGAIWESALAAALEDGIDEDHPRLSGERLGNCLYFEAAGHGVSWQDDFPAIPGYRAPRIEHSVETLEIEDGEEDEASPSMG